jgi:hypothetical protein
MGCYNEGVENKISPVQVFRELKGTLLSDISPLERPYVEQFNTMARSSVSADLYWLQPFYEVFVPELVPPQNVREAKDYGSFGALSLPWALHQMGTTLDKACDDINKQIQAVFTREGEKIEARYIKMEMDLAYFDVWLNNRVRNMAGNLVDLYFWRYKHYHPVPAETVESILESLEEAGVRSLIIGLFRHFKDEGQELLLEPISPLLQGDYDLDRPLETMGHFSTKLLLCLVDCFEVLAARLADKQVWSLLEDKLCDGLSESCQRQVEIMERYGERYGYYHARTTDQYLSIVQFDPRKALWFSMILESKDSKRTIEQQCREEGEDVRDVRNFKRRLDYALQKQLNSGR